MRGVLEMWLVLVITIVVVAVAVAVFVRKQSILCVFVNPVRIK
jgi:hypothetical protein